MFKGRPLLFSVLVRSATLSAMGAQPLDLPVLYGKIPEWAISFLLLVSGVPSALMALSASISAGLLGEKWREFGVTLAGMTVLFTLVSYWSIIVD